MAAWRRFDSLFARLLLLQVLLAAMLMVVFGVLVYVERNAAVARLVAERWAPSLRQAAGRTGQAPEVLRELQRRAQPPERTLEAPFSAPRMAALDDALRRQGVPLERMLIARGEAAPTLWLQLSATDGSRAWFGLSEPALLPNVSGRVLVALLVTGVVLFGVSWVFTRRLTRPLDRLRARMQQQLPGMPATAGEPRARATPELEAIESAYAELLQRFDRHERERALLLAGVSHDLRSPLARIRMAADLLPQSAEGEPWREAIVRNTQVADRLIESFLDHVRAGELALDRVADVAVLARGVGEASGQGADALRVVAPDTLPLRQTHPLLVERLLANLLDNAFKHGRAPVELRVEARGAVAVVLVIDAGAGVPEARREQVQQAFSRGDASRGVPGTGLGLAIVARVVARMGGTLAFDRHEGRHVVRVELPGAISPRG
jgi:two-component system osmolarity sensor histidine kinase EnvZ